MTTLAKPDITYPLPFELTERQSQQLVYLQRSCGYWDQVKVHGKLPASELALFTHNVDKQVIAAWRNPNTSFGVVLLDDGELLDGIFHLFDDGTCSVS